MTGTPPRKKSWHCLELAVPQTIAEDVSACCFELGSCGLQTQEAGEWVRLVVYFDAALELEPLRRQLEECLAGLTAGRTEVAVGRLEQADWETEWRRFFQPVWVTSRLVVHPSWIPVETGPGQLAVVIDPQMAFGTGTHESTQLCLQLLEEYLRPGDRCLDLGTGSGILAIAAARRGAGRVLALDIDPCAVDTAGENLERNGVDRTRVEVRLGSVEQVAGRRFELVLANIQSQVLRPLLEPIRPLLATEGRVVFSGLLDDERSAFCVWVEQAGLRIERERSRNGWWCIAAGRA
jgi:ribosomal protein L11 methyltransferase